MAPIKGHLKDEKNGSSRDTFHPNAPFFNDGGFKINKVLKFFFKRNKKMNLIDKNVLSI